MRRDRLLRQHLRERFVVTLDTREAFNGLIVNVDLQSIEMADVGSLGPQGKLTPIDGSLFLERARVLYMQRP